jgi:hypothetical protein
MHCYCDSLYCKVNYVDLKGKFHEMNDFFEGLKYQINIFCISADGFFTLEFASEPPPPPDWGQNYEAEFTL